MSDIPVRLLYFANVRLPSERANAIQIVNMCSVFAASGREVLLLHPKRYNRFKSEKASLFEHYGVAENFGVKQLYSLDFIDRLPRALQYPAFRVQSLTYGLSAVRVMQRAEDAVFYIRDNATLALACSLLPEKKRRRLIYEAHDFPEREGSVKAFLRAAGRCGGIVSITGGLKRRFEEAGLPESRLHVAPDGVDAGRFEDLPSREEARLRLGLPADKKLVIYTGQLFPWKGVDTLVQAASLLENALVVLVGGREEDRKRLEKAAHRDRVVFRDHVAPDRVPLFLAAAHVLVLPNSGKYPISTHYTSPLKLFEYMAARRPMVASDLPSLREVLSHGENALLVPPDDAPALAKAIGGLLTDCSLGDRLAAGAADKVGGYTWQERARGIWRFIDGLFTERS